MATGRDDQLFLKGLAHSISAPAAMKASMMGGKRKAQGRLFYAFDPEMMVPQDHRLRKIDAAPDLSSLRAEKVMRKPA